MHSMPPDLLAGNTGRPRELVGRRHGRGESARLNHPWPVEIGVLSCDEQN